MEPPPADTPARSHSPFHQSRTRQRSRLVPTVEAKTRSGSAHNIGGQALGIWGAVAAEGLDRKGGRATTRSEDSDLVPWTITR